MAATAAQIAFSLQPLGLEAVPIFDQLVTVEPHPDGDGLSALKYADGKYASLLGTWDVHKATAGADERFMVNAGTITAFRSGTVRVFPAQGIVVRA